MYEADSAAWLITGLTGLDGALRAGQTITEGLLHKAYICFVPGAIADFRLPRNY